MKTVIGAFEKDEIKIKSGLKTLLKLSWPDITSIDVEGPEQVEKRVTATRLLTLGLFAFAAKKKQKVAYVTIATEEGELIFECMKLVPQEARAKLSWAIAKAN
jgi:Mg-chelatase subunit ChlD